ncbi:TetR/AcrR family transcriptional regulator [Niallia circulans]|uniref:TetR/AcrR family transcriptional regulator n=1 Tax=Niallia circulans TaxID=1397 RepID=A0A553SLZ4_NIACI|nr:TetR/AcrR family transcriptional regulator [Niallia circulans]TRZ38008.1 TetR/AcrR family transcriptional regulator [Niallia circulans]
MFCIQAKKEEVKNQIEAAALTVFFEKGFIKAKMSDIAEEINISVGNIYTYFKNKNELFYTVVPPSLVDYLQKILVESIHIVNQKFFDGTNDKEAAIYQEQIHLLTEYHRQIVIIFEKSHGTVYSNAKNELIELMIETKKPYMKNTYKKHDITKDENTILLTILANSFVDMILDLLKREMSAESRKRIFEMLSIYRLHGINSLNE